MSRNAPYAYENPYASVPTTDAPSSSSSSAPMTYPPALASQLQLSGADTPAAAGTTTTTTTTNASAAFAGAGTRPQFYYASPPSTATPSYTTSQTGGQGHRPYGSVSSVSLHHQQGSISNSNSGSYQHQHKGSISGATLKNAETESPKPWPATLPHVATTSYDKTYDYPYAYDSATHKRVDSDAFNPYDNPALSHAHTRPLPRPHQPGYTMMNRDNDPNRWSYDTVDRPEGVRMFSPAWFKYHWAVQSSRKRLGRLLYIACGLILLAGWLTVTMLFGRNLETNEASNSRFSAHVENGLLPPPPDRIGTLFLVGQLNSFDPFSRNLNLDWTAIQVSQPIDTSDILKTQIDIDRREDTVPLAMFRDVLAVPDLETNITDYQPYRVQNPHVKPVGFLGLTQFDQINTNIGMGQRSTNFWSQPEFGYPFDVFQGKITWVAANNDTITATGRPGTDVQAISGAILTDSLL
ncbi:hypothetical protein FRC19_009377 [Serendipita sp. 401]|nr:hypothetical protein FRC19_009377 [Serendipita sp. 401]KAG9053037.1 hypothetical protein FS842_008767 [Serendipita sp. 407]